MAQAIVGLFADRSSAERAIEDLKAAGFNQNRIGVVMQDKQEAREVAKEHGTRSTEGAVTGSLIGGTAGALLVATGALVVPGIGPFITGGTAGWLVGAGIPKEEAAYYEEQVQQGRVLVMVDAPGREDEAREILRRDGAENLHAETTSAVTGAAPRSAQASRSSETTTQTDDIRVPVVEEELVAGKRAEGIGRVHLHKDVVEEQQSVSIPLEQERVYVERVPVNEATNAASATDAFVERDIDVPVRGEEAVVEKRVHAAEEVRLHKDVITEQQHVSDTVRKERVTIDPPDADVDTLPTPTTIDENELRR